METYIGPGADASSYTAARCFARAARRYPANSFEVSVRIS